MSLCSVCLSLTYFTYYNTLKIHPSCHKCQDFLSSYCQLIFQYIYVPHFLSIHKHSLDFEQHICDSSAFDTSINRIKEHVVLCVWLLSLTITVIGFTHVKSMWLQFIHSHWGAIFHCMNTPVLLYPFFCCWSLG